MSNPESTPVTRSTKVVLRAAAGAEAELRIVALSGDPEFETVCAQAYRECAPKLEERPVIKLFGAEARQRRDVGFFSDQSEGYRYSGQLAASQPLEPGMARLLDLVNATTGARFNGVLVNRYNGGNDYIGKHSDDESALDVVGVASITYYPEHFPTRDPPLRPRDFRVRARASGVRLEDGRALSKNDVAADVPLRNLDLCWMYGKDFQRTFAHEVPRRATSKDLRVSFTFRKHLI
jgi:alpha-ketoglutarate-dependent dioxygenase alkB family protein 2